jgi:hypothetical protein
MNVSLLGRPQGSMSRRQYPTEKGTQVVDGGDAYLDAIGPEQSLVAVRSPLSCE